MKHPSSREYKMMLKPGAFAGSDTQRATAVAAFWDGLDAQLSDRSIKFGKQLALSSARDVVFLDTPDRQLYERLDLILRLRRAQTRDSSWDVALKFRHGDRLQASAQTSGPRKSYAPQGPDVTFEEDVKGVETASGLGFWAQFSHCARAQIGQADMLSDVADLRRIYARLPEQLTTVSAASLLPVGGLAIVEDVFDGGRLTLADARAEAAVILWFRDGDHHTPIAAEFSFRFQLHKGRAEPATAVQAWRLFQALQHLDGVDPDGRTKTALVYRDGKG